MHHFTPDFKVFPEHMLVALAVSYLRNAAELGYALRNTLGMRDADKLANDWKLLADEIERRGVSDKLAEP